MDYEAKIKHIAIYGRKSRLNEGSDEAKTLGTQLKHLQDYANSKGWSYELYCEVVSGTESSRTEFNRLITDITKCNYDGILLQDVDRASRSVVDFARFKDACAATLTLILTPTAIINPALPEDTLTAQLLSVLSEYEVNMFKKRVKRSKMIKAKEGKWVVGNTPIGYKRDELTGKLTVDEKTAPIVREAFDLILQDYSLRKMTAILNSKGFRDRKSVV